MDNHENEELARQYIEEAWNDGNSEFVDELFADFGISVEFVIAEGDLASIGRHEGEPMGRESSNEHVGCQI